MKDSNGLISIKTCLQAKTSRIASMIVSEVLVLMRAPIILLFDVKVMAPLSNKKDKLIPIMRTVMRSKEKNKWRSIPIKENILIFLCNSEVQQVVSDYEAVKNE
ncbi:hypothetical protein D3C80_1239110 [compost metagenome]